MAFKKMSGYLMLLGARAANAEPAKTEIVLSHYNEDLSWVSKYVSKKDVDVTIYSKNEDPPAVVDAAPVLPLPNVGRESQTYLHHIVYKYKKLADWTVFTQACSPSWGYLIGNSSNGHLNDKTSFEDYLRPEGRDSMFVMTAASQFPKGAQATRLGIVTTGLPDEGSEICPKQGEHGWTDWWFTPDHPHLRKGNMLDFYYKYIALDKNDGKPLTLTFAQGARFAVSRARIQARPRRYYSRLLVALSKDSSPQEGYWMEAAWYDVFHPEALQSKTILCKLPVVNEVLPLGPYLQESIVQRVQKDARDARIAHDFLRRLYRNSTIAPQNSTIAPTTEYGSSVESSVKSASATASIFLCLLAQLQA